MATLGVFSLTHALRGASSIVTKSTHSAYPMGHSNPSDGLGAQNSLNFVRWMAGERQARVSLYYEGVRHI